ncbi:carbohydrate ABC transporter permease [Metabacillus sp. SLBN-84]
MMINKTSRVGMISTYFILTLISLLMIYPFAWMIISSFRPSSDILTSPFRIDISSLTLEAYEKIALLGGVSIWKYVFNSLIITLFATLLIIIVTSLGAYAIYRKPTLPGFKILENGFLLSIMYPAVLLLIPLYVISFKLELLGTYKGIIFILAGGAWGGALPFFLFRQFFAKIPQEVIEAAEIDGASEFRILRRIVVPLAMPVYATATLITFMLTWGLWLPVLVISNDTNTYTLATALVNLNSELGIDFQSTMALSTLVTVPIVIIFLLTQKRVMEGISAGSVKG